MYTVFYHKADHDGELSAFIAKSYLLSQGHNVQLIGVDYGQTPDVLAMPLEDLDVVLLDFTFETQTGPDIMQGIAERAQSFTWIDHHISSIKKYAEINASGMRNAGFSACELTWIFYYPELVMPVGIKYIGIYDTWRHKDQQEIIAFEYYMQGLDTDPLSPDCVWGSVWDWNKQELIANSYEKGLACLRRQKRIYARELEAAFPITIQGHNCLVMNTQSKGSDVFGDSMDKYDFCLCYKNFQNKYLKFSIYTRNPDLDCSELAQHFHGGGHHGAAGFEIKKLEDLYV